MFNFNDIEQERVRIASDWHFNHNNIVVYTKRPGFDPDGQHNFEEHNKLILANYLRDVKDDTIVINLGDVAMRERGVNQWGTKLNGNIYVIRGNHDKKEIVSAWEAIGWKTIQPLCLLFDEGEVWLTHYPQYSLPPRVANIYGHTHNSPTPELDKTGRHFCACVERNDYNTITLKSALAELSFPDKPWAFKYRDTRGQRPPMRTIDLRTKVA